MAQADLKDIINTLFTAPVEASLMAEEGYRRIWIEWLKKLAKILDGTGGGKDLIESHLDMAPVMKFEAAIDVAITMRIVTVKETSGGGGLGLAVGPFQASGQFGFSNQNTSDSTLSARARYQLSNTNEQTLRGYLADAGIPVTKKEELPAAIEKMEATVAKEA